MHWPQGYNHFCAFFGLHLLHFHLAVSWMKRYSRCCPSLAVFPVRSSIPGLWKERYSRLWDIFHFQAKKIKSRSIFSRIIWEKHRTLPWVDVLAVEPLWLRLYLAALQKLHCVGYQTKMNCEKYVHRTFRGCFNSVYGTTWLWHISRFSKERFRSKHIQLVHAPLISTRL